MKKIWKVLLSLLLVLVLVVGGYVAYVFLDYSRLEDALPLEVVSASQESTGPTTGVPYRILSYNIGFGAYSDDYSFFMDGGKESRVRSEEDLYRNVGGAMAAAQSAAPDFLFIQEVDEDGTRSCHIDQRKLVREAFPEMNSVYAQNYDSPYLFWPILEPHGANKAGLMALSRFPITGSIRRSLPIDTGVMKLVDLDRCYSVSRIPMENGKELVLFAFHLSAYTADGAIADNQLKMLFADMLAEVEKGNYAIAGGDFNKDILGNSPEVFHTASVDGNWALPLSVELIPEGLTVVAPLDEEAPVPSCRNADRPYGPDDLVLTVDGFVVSDNVTVLDSTVLDEGFRWSDHNPVYMDFLLK